ncbi:MAG: hypothetical protein V1860_01605, partial [bacterium]
MDIQEKQTFIKKAVIFILIYLLIAAIVPDFILSIIFFIFILYIILKIALPNNPILERLNKSWRTAMDLFKNKFSAGNQHYVYTDFTGKTEKNMM